MRRILNDLRLMKLFLSKGMKREILFQIEILLISMLAAASAIPYLEFFQKDRAAGQTIPDRDRWIYCCRTEEPPVEVDFDQLLLEEYGLTACYYTGTVLCARGSQAESGTVGIGKEKIPVLLYSEALYKTFCDHNGIQGESGALISQKYRRMYPQEDVLPLQIVGHSQNVTVDRNDRAMEIRQAADMNGRRQVFCISQSYGTYRSLNSLFLDIGEYPYYAILRADEDSERLLDKNAAILIADEKTDVEETVFQLRQKYGDVAFFEKYADLAGTSRELMLNDRVVQAYTIVCLILSIFLAVNIFGYWISNTYHYQYTYAVLSLLGLTDRECAGLQARLNVLLTLPAAVLGGLLSGVWANYVGIQESNRFSRIAVVGILMLYAVILILTAVITAENRKKNDITLLYKKGRK